MLEFEKKKNNTRTESTERRKNMTSIVLYVVLCITFYPCVEDLGRLGDQNITPI